MTLRSRILATLPMLAFATTAFAAAKPMTASKDLILPTDHDSPVGTLATVYSTNFEAPVWTATPVEPQNGFTATGVNLPWASISGVGPCEALQSMRLVKNAAAGNGAQHLVFSPSILQPANTPSQVKMWVNISADGGADYDVIGQAPSQAFLSWRVRFSWSDAAGTGPGTIFILDDIGAGLEFVDTGVIWSENVCQELKVQFDPALGEIRYFYGGVQIYTGIIVAGTAVEQIVWRSDNWQNAGESGSFDALNWIDTPSDPVPAETTSWGKVKSQYR